MDMPSSWLTELEMQDHMFMNQYPYYYPPMEDFSFDSFSSDSYTEAQSFIDQSIQTHIEEPAQIEQQFNYKSYSINNKLPKTAKPKPKLVNDTPSTFTISFGDIQPKDEFLSFSDSNALKKGRTTIRSPMQVQDHVLAERKRREKLAKRFLSLSSLLPDLKKTDKATILEDAANYIKELQNRVKELEGLSVIKGKNMQESIITESTSPCNSEIEVSTTGCSLLVEIYSRNNCISLLKVLNEMKKLGLSIISCSTMPFADTTLLVTIVAQKNDEFIMSSADLVKNLQLVV